MISRPAGVVAAVGEPQQRLGIGDDVKLHLRIALAGRDDRVG
jgi:hypothetical protein